MAGALVAVALLSVGSARAQGADVVPDTVDFGEQALGTSGTPADMTLKTSATECGNPTCTSDVVQFFVNTAVLGEPGGVVRHPGFEVANLDCPPQLVSPLVNGATATCMFRVTFAPAILGMQGLSLAFPEIFSADGQVGNGINGTFRASGVGLAVPALAPPGTSPGPVATGQRAAALKRCKQKAKKKHLSRKARKKCRKRARKLPV